MGTDDKKGTTMAVTATLVLEVTDHVTGEKILHRAVEQVDGEFTSWRSADVRDIAGEALIKKITDAADIWP